MKLFISVALLLCIGIQTACTTAPEDIAPVGTTKLGNTTLPASATTNGSEQPPLQGSFVTNAHTTSGIVKVSYANGKRMLVFTDFKADTGPDLRIYLAENINLRNFIEVSKLDNETRGNFSVDLPVFADPVKQRYVLIWCKEFSILFGNAELK